MNDDRSIFHYERHRSTLLYQEHAVVPINLKLPLITASTCVPFAEYPGSCVRFGCSRNHDVPSRAMETSQDPAGLRPQTRFVTIAVFGVSVTYLNVTVLVPPMGHEPVNVPMRIGFFSFSVNRLPN